MAYHITWLTGEFECPHECGYKYSQDEGEEFMEQINESKGKSGMIRRKSKCCKRFIWLTIGLTGIVAFRK